MLRSIQLQDFKSFRDETIPLDRLTLLVGANASGKSNVFDAIRFLQGLALGMSVVDVLRGRWEGGREIWSGIRGGTEEIARASAREFGISTEWLLDDAAVLTHGIACQAERKHPPQVTIEFLRGESMGAYLFDTHAKTLGEGGGLMPGGALKVGIKATGGGRTASHTASAAFSLLTQDLHVDRVDPLVDHWSERVRSAMKRVLPLDITPSRMRGYVNRSATQLGAEGENLSAVV